ncbi:MAG: ribonuclease HII [Alphaproteobacteria bacterium]|nr:ribonuclease HII [Alphaproteobacteria bacterium]
MPSFELENGYPGEVVCGVDEAGLGPLAGALVVAACHIMDQHLPVELMENIDDSKRLTGKKREHTFGLIETCTSIKYGISIIENTEIDAMGLSKAWQKGIVDAVSKLSIFCRPTLCLLDGKRKVEIPNCKCVPVIKGDQKSFSIATASIIAKVTRDRIMRKIHEEFPQYGFDKHVGYGTRQHLEALSRFGACKYHRQSYAPVAKVVRSKMEK